MSDAVQAAWDALKDLPKPSLARELDLLVILFHSHSPEATRAKLPFSASRRREPQWDFQECTPARWVSRQSASLASFRGRRVSPN